MAVKGKKKSRGSHGRRHPAQAPRPDLIARRKLPWYRTRNGLMALAGGAVLLLTILVILVINLGSNDEGLEASQRQLERFTSEVRGLAQDLRPAVSQMSQPTSPESPETLPGNPDEWAEILQAGANTAQGIAAPAGSENLLRIYADAALLYLDAAQTYALAQDAPGDLAAEILVRASSQRDRANSLWATAATELDQQRADAELGGSQISPPAVPPAGSQPSATPTQGAGGNGGGGNGGNGGGGGN